MRSVPSLAYFAPPPAQDNRKINRRVSQREILGREITADPTGILPKLFMKIITNEEPG